MRINAPRSASSRGYRARVIRRGGSSKPPVPHNIHELLTLHVEASTRLVDLIDVFTKERDAGNLTVARQAIVQAQRLLDEIKALDGHARML